MVRSLTLALLLFFGLGQPAAVAQSSECDWSIELVARLGADSLVERLTACLDDESLDEQTQKRLLKQRALSYALSGRFEDALADRAQIIRLFPEESEGWPLRAVVYTQFDIFSWGVGDFEEILELSQESPEYYIRVGNAFYSIGEFDMAFTYYQTSLMREARRVDSDLNIGGVHFILGRYAEALASYESALAKKQGIASAHFGKALAYYHLGEVRKAVDELERAVGVEEHNFFRSHYALVLADLLLDLGAAEAAIAATNLAVAMDDEYHHAGNVKRAIAYAAMDRLADALSELDHAAEEFGTSFAVSLLRGDILCRAGQERKARTQWTSARAIPLDEIEIQRFAWRRKVLLKELGFYEGPIDFEFDDAARAAERRWVEAGCPWLSVNIRTQSPNGPTFRSLDR